MHNFINIFNTTELYTEKWLRWYMLCYMYVTTIFLNGKKKTKKERTFSLSHIVLQFSLSTGITFFSSGAQGLKAFSNHFCCSQALFILSIRFRQGLYSSDFQLWIY